MKCTACGKELLRRDVLYTESKHPYCPNPFDCNEKHPNSVINILERKGAVKLFTEEELETNMFENLNVSPEMKKRISKVATKPQSIRLSKIEIAYYILQLQESKHLSSISEAVRYCIEQTMEREPLDHVLAIIPDESSDDVEVITPKIIEKASGVKIIPKSLNVDWNAVDKQIKQQKAEEASDDLEKTNIIQEADDELVF